MRGALKFETKNFHGVASLFWDQKAQSKDKKKFGYKSRHMKFPLRGNNAVGPSGDTPKVQPSGRSNVNKRDIPGTVQRSNRSADNQRPDAKQKTKETSYTKPKKHPFAETVTLTKAQLEAILASVGKLPAADKTQSSYNETYSLAEKAEDENQERDSRPYLDSAAITNQDGSHIVKNGETSSTKEIFYEHPAKKLKQDSPQHREASEKNSVANLQINVQMNTEGNRARIPVPDGLEKATKPHPVIQPLSLAERKKQQWQREKAEQLQLYDPWGRPGAGAPLLDSKGQVITNYKAYNSQVNTLTNGQVGLIGNVPSEIGQQANLSHPPQPTSANFGESSHLADTHGQKYSAREMETSESSELSGMSFANQCNPSDTDRTKSSRPVAVVPAAMRSSFQIGYNEIPDYESIRVDEKRKWLLELEKQKEEHRLRKQEQKDKFNSPAESNPFTSGPSSMTQRSDATFVSQKSNHLRCHLNLHMDPITQQQLELKKRKNEDLMLEIKAQINEQQKQKQLELEKQQLEEAADEQRLLADQRLLNQQYQQELVNDKQKMEAKEQKLKQLAATIDQAREDAILDKKLKRLQYLEKNGHDTSRLQADLAATCRSLSCEQPNKDTRNAASSSENRTCHQDEALSNVREGIPNQLPYQSKIRDFASQTDTWLLSKLSELSDVEIEYESEQEEEKNIANVRPSGNKGNVRPSGNKGKPMKIQERPTWGYQNPNSKNPVKNYNHLSRQGTEKNVSNQKTGSLVYKDKREIHPKLNSGTGVSKAPKQSSVSQRPRLGSQQDKVSLQVKAGHNQSSTKSDTRRGQENRKEILRRDPSPPVPTLRKKAAEAGATMKPTMEPVMNRRPRGVSPPVPALRRKLQGGRQEIDKGELDIQIDTYNYNQMKSVGQQARPARKTNKYADNIRVGSPAPQNDFIPFTRTSDVLDPTYADSPLPISREQSLILRGRQSYWKGQHPGNFGDAVEHFIDQPMSEHEKPNMKTTLEDASLSEKKALFQQLSALKQKLRQLELETSTSMLEPQLTP